MIKHKKLRNLWIYKTKKAINLEDRFKNILFCPKNECPIIIEEKNPILREIKKNVIFIDIFDQMKKLII